MIEQDWWKVDNLIKKEEKISNIDDNEVLEGPNGGDFGSYRKVAKGVDIKDTLLSKHNDLNSKNKIAFIHKLLSTEKGLILDVLDVGCGMGYTTHELGKFYNNSAVVGVDVSSDGISYAIEKFKNEMFIRKGIAPPKTLR